MGLFSLCGRSLLLARLDNNAGYAKLANSSLSTFISLAFGHKSFRAFWMNELKQLQDNDSNRRSTDSFSGCLVKLCIAFKRF